MRNQLNSAVQWAQLTPQLLNNNNKRNTKRKTIPKNLSLFHFSFLFSREPNGKKKKKKKKKRINEKIEKCSTVLQWLGLRWELKAYRVPRFTIFGLTPQKVLIFNVRRRFQRANSSVILFASEKPQARPCNSLHFKSHFYFYFFLNKSFLFWLYYTLKKLKYF